MTRERLYLFDTTLRDGALTTGVDFSLDDKRHIAAMLDELGDRLCRRRLSRRQSARHQVLREEADQARQVLRVRHDQAARALGRQRSRRRRAAGGRRGRDRLSSPRAGIITCMSRSAARWRKTSNASATACARRSRRAARRWSIASISSTATRRTRPTRCNARKAAYEAGARWVVLCDTNGGTLPHEVERIVREVAEAIPGERLGIHAHNDTDNAVANSLAAVRAGVRQVQGTLNGLGERCGNANLVSLIPTLALKHGFRRALSRSAYRRGARRTSRGSRTVSTNC